MTRYSCCDRLRRNAVDAHPTLNGIDYLDVLDHDAPAGSPRQRTLLVRCLKPVPALTREQVRLTGGERVREIAIEWVASASSPPAALTNAAEQAFFSALPDADHVLLVRTSAAGDYSPYLLGLQRAADDLHAPNGFDPQLIEISFSFKVECPSDFDCQPQHTCQLPLAAQPDINYLSKDYASFRRLMLDRLSQLLPDWDASTPADLGVMLVELLAYAGDQLSYWQDAVATEAYLETARRRTSLRRHALLVDYQPHEGSNARAWVQLQLAAGVPSAVIALSGLRFLTRVPDVPGRVPDDPAARAYRDVFAATPTVFEPMDPAGALQLSPAASVTVYAAHHQMSFYTWGDQRCCLPLGATSATLSGHFDTLVPGDMVIVEEVKGPLTGAAGDADPAHCHALRLTSVITTDGNAPLVDPLNGAAITAISWADADALPFPLCISARTDDEHGGQLISDVSVARGNLVLADHGQRISGEALGTVPAAQLRWPAQGDTDRCALAPPEPLPVRFRPALMQRPLTHAGTVQRVTLTNNRLTRATLAFDPQAPAAQAFVWNDNAIQPVIQLSGTVPVDGTPVSTNWDIRRDLLDSDANAPHFVVESEHDGSATLRFGDDQHGKRPETGTVFQADYRIGQGLTGNIGADALAHVVTNDVRLAAVRNPLSARGGSEPESAAQIRRRAPQAFRTQQRAVTPEDYAAVTGRFHTVQRAAATQRWTGSWHTMFITVDRAGGGAMPASERAALAAFVEPYRMAGHDLEFNDPIYVPLRIEMTVCVAADYFRGDVRAALLQVLGSRDLPDGRRGLFHPDALTFGQAVYVSPIYAAARGVAGVEAVEITAFGRQDRRDDLGPLQSGVLQLGRLEIAQLANDRNFPERGTLSLALHGGK